MFSYLFLCVLCSSLSFMSSSLHLRFSVSYFSISLLFRLVVVLLLLLGVLLVVLLCVQVFFLCCVFLLVALSP